MPTNRSISDELLQELEDGGGIQSNTQVSLELSGLRILIEILYILFAVRERSLL